MEEAFNNIFCCCTFGEGDKACEKEPQGDYQENHRRMRGRSRTRRININANFCSDSTEVFKEKFAGRENPEEDFNSPDFTLEADKTNKKNRVAGSLKDNKNRNPKDTIKNVRKQAQKRRCRQPPSTARLRKTRNTVLRQGNSKSDTIERKNGKKHPKDLTKNGRKRSSAQKRSRRLRHKIIPKSRTAQDTTLREEHSKSKMNKSGKDKHLDNKEKSLFTWRGRYSIPSKCSINRSRTIEGTISRQGYEKTKKMEESTQRVNSEQETQAFSGNTRVTSSTTFVSKKEPGSRNDCDIKSISKAKGTSARASSESTRTTDCSIDTKIEPEKHSINIMKASRQKKFEKSALKSRLLKNFGSIPRARSNGKFLTNKLRYKY